jgi:hypothetical protein
MHRFPDLCEECSMRTAVPTVSVVAALTAALVSVTGSAAEAVPAKTCRPGVNAAEYWIFNSGELASLQNADPARTAHGVKTSAVFDLAAPGVTRAGRGTRPVAYYKSYARFSSDLSAGNIPAGTHYVAYDNESWSDTPRNERQDPMGYQHKFADLAHAHGYNIILMPSQDTLPGFTGPTTASWDQYVARYAPASAEAAGEPGDIVEIQAQAYEEPRFRGTGYYLTALTQAADAAHAANPGAILFAGISTSRVQNPGQLATDWSNAAHLTTGSSTSLIDGFWLNITGDTPSGIATAAGFLAAIPTVADSAAPTCPLPGTR